MDRRPVASDPMDELRTVPMVMQAPIGPATTPRLVAAVSSAGGLGCLAASWTSLRRLREQLHDIRRETDGPFCVNLVLAFDQAERLELLVEERVPAISFSWGVDADAISAARAAGATVLVQIADVPAARRAAEAGADVLIAQGIEAGGHVESRTTLAELVHDLRAEVSLPILAAGGIADAASVAAALGAGAHGIAVGTAYLAATEADVHPVYRDRVIEADGTDTELTGLFDIGWPDAPHRVLRNATFETWRANGSPPAPDRPGEGEPVATRNGRTVVRYSDEQPTHGTEGDIAAMALYAGLGVGAIARIEDAATITERLLAATNGP